MEQARPRTSTRDLSEIARQLAVWLAVQVRADGPVAIARPRGPGGAGFSSETLLLAPLTLPWVAE